MRIWEEIEGGGWRVETGRRRNTRTEFSLLYAILGHMGKQEMEIKWKVETETGNWKLGMGPKNALITGAMFSSGTHE